MPRTPTCTVIALLATTALAPPAFAQSAPAPRFIAPDSNGVDLTTGQVSFSLDEGGIGSGEGAVRMQRIWAQEAGWVDNWSGGLYTVTTGGVTKTYVQIAGISDVFSQSGSTYTSDNAQGSTLALIGGILTYKAADGTKIEFGTAYTNFVTYACPGADPRSCRIPTSITRPNGLKFDFEWQDYLHCLTETPGEGCTMWEENKRLFRVTSSAGYSLQISYAVSYPALPPYKPDPPSPDWFKRTGVSFANSAQAATPAPAIGYAYPSANVVEVTDPAERKWVLTTSSDKLSGIRRPGSASDNISYVYTGGTVTSAMKDGVATTYARTVSGTTATTTATDALGNSRVIISDLTKGRPTSYEDELDWVTSYQYDANARLTRVTQPEGNYVSTTYDARGNVTQSRSVAKPGSGLADIVTSAAYDATCSNPVKCNKPNSTTDARSNTTDYTYDTTHGGLLTTTSPAPTTGAVRPQSRYSYAQVAGAGGESVYMVTGVSACQTLASCTGAADESKSTIHYNSNLLPDSVSSGNGTGTLTATRTIIYDPRGNVTSVDEPLPGTSDTWVYKYDAADQPVGAISPDPDGAGTLPNRATRVTYRPDGQVEKQERGTTAGQSDANWAAFAPAETLETLFDINSRPKLQRLLGGTSRQTQTQFSYDVLGRLQCSAVRMDRNEFTNSSNLGACTLGANTNPYDRLTRFFYDAVGRHTKSLVGYQTVDEVYEVQKIYTANGHLRTLFDGNVNRTTYEYDGFDRLSKTFFPDKTVPNTSSTTDWERLTYDANGNVTERRLRGDALSIVYTYDKLNRPITKDLPASEPDVTFKWDNLGRLTSADQTGNDFDFTYDALGRNLTQVGPQGSVCSQWDLAGQRTKLTYPTSNCADANAFSIVYAYLTTGDVRDMYEGGGFHLTAFDYDNLGNRISLTRGNGAVTSYTYDVVSRLSVLDQNPTGTAQDLLIRNIVYNPASQIVSLNRTNDAYAWTGHGNGSTAYGVNGLNQVTSVGGVATAHDARGNLTTEPQSGKTYTYTSENLLLTASGGGVPTATLAYDPLMRLRQSSNSTATTRFAYDGVGMIAEYNTNNIVQKRFVFAPGIDEPLVEYTGSGTTGRKWLHADERGSIIAMSDDSGNVTQFNKYDEFGKPQTTNAGRFQYTGQMWLSELNAYYYKARVYVPQLGRFLQPDPVGYGSGMNLYAYVGADPVNFVDPLGLTEVDEPVMRPLDPPIVVTGKLPNAYDFLWDRSLFGPSYYAPPGAEGGGGGGGSGESDQSGGERPCSSFQKYAEKLGDIAAKTSGITLDLGAGGQIAGFALSKSPNARIASLGTKIGTRGAAGVLLTMSGSSAVISLVAYGLSGQSGTAIRNQAIASAVDHILGRFHGPLGTQLADKVTSDVQSDFDKNRCAQ